MLKCVTDVICFQGRRRKVGDRGHAGVGEVSSADEESEVERLGDTDGDEQVQSRPKLRPFRRGRRRRTRLNPGTEYEDGNEDEGVGRDELELENELEEDARDMVTPKATRVRDDGVQSTPCSSAPQRGAHAGSGVELESDDLMMTPGRLARVEQDGAERADVGETKAMLQSKKRLREEEMELSPSPLPQVELETLSTPVDDVHVRRKRIRR